LPEPWAWSTRRSDAGAWQDLPQPWVRPKLTDALATSLEDLDRLLAEGRPVERERISVATDEPADDPEHDPVLSAPWSHRGNVEAAVVLGGDGQVERREVLLLTGPALTAPAHQWLVHEPEPLMSRLSGRRVSAVVVDRLTTMIAELRTMDDVAGGGMVLSLAQQEFGLVSELLDQASYDEPAGRKPHIALAELGQLAGWASYDAGHQGLAQRYYIAAPHAAHSADDRPLGAHVLACMAHQSARQGHPVEAVTLIETAVAVARGRETASLMAELYSRQAHALATLGDASTEKFADISRPHLSADTGRTHYAYSLGGCS
jgi:hypothetical protein